MSADCKILKYLKEIKNILKLENINAIGISTDSDNAYRSMFKQFYDEWAKHLQEANGNIMRIKLDSALITNDCPHLLKRARSRLVTKNICSLTNQNGAIGKKLFQKTVF